MEWKKILIVLQIQKRALPFGCFLFIYHIIHIILLRLIILINHKEDWNQWLHSIWQLDSWEFLKKKKRHKQTNKNKPPKNPSAKTQKTPLNPNQSTKHFGDSFIIGDFVNSSFLKTENSEILEFYAFIVKLSGCRQQEDFLFSSLWGLQRWKNIHSFVDTNPLALGQR